MKLNDRILVATAAYFLGRRKANDYECLRATAPVAAAEEFGVEVGAKVWDKHAALKALTAACGKTYRFVASAGQFWFVRRCGSGDAVITMNEKSWPNAKSVRSVGEI